MKDETERFENALLNSKRSGYAPNLARGTEIHLKMEADTMTTQGKVQHTLGPWKVDWDEEEPLTVVREHGDAIAELPKRTPEYEANARLIAAAPDLLEALRALIERPQGYAPNDLECLARAAIAKAEGQ